MAHTPDTRTILEELESLPLMGDSLARHKALRATLTRRLTSKPDPQALLRSQLRFGRLLLVFEAPDTSTYLEELARKAEHSQLDDLACQTWLVAARAHCLQGDLPRAQNIVLLQEPRVTRDLEARFDLMLARAWSSATDAEALLVLALDKLPPYRDHDRLAALLELADRCESGGDPYRARSCLDRALALAERHHATRQIGRAALLLGSLQLREGELEGAKVSLARALACAEQVQDTLTTAAAGTLVVGLMLNDEAWEPLLTSSDRLLAVARQRVNPAMLTSLTLDRATAWRALDRPDRSIGELLGATLELETADEQLPLNLIKARFAEMLAELGQERFEKLVEAELAKLGTP